MPGIIGCLAPKIKKVGNRRTMMSCMIWGNRQWPGLYSAWIKIWVA